MALGMSLLAAPTAKSVAAMRQTHGASMSTALSSGSALEPKIRGVFQRQRRLEALSRAILVHAIYLATASWTLVSVASQLLAMSSFAVARFAAVRSALLSYWLGKALWASPPLETLRKKAVFEFNMFVLGAGNGLFLVMFWPGWWVIGATVLAVGQLCG